MNAPVCSFPRCGNDRTSDLHAGCASDHNELMIHDTGPDGFCHRLDCHPFEPDEPRHDGVLMVLDMVASIVTSDRTDADVGLMLRRALNEPTLASLRSRMSSSAEMSRQIEAAIASEERALAVGDTIVAQFCHGYPYREEHEGSDDWATVFDARGEVFAKMSGLSDAQTLVSIINDACSRAYVCPNGGPTVEPWIIHSTCPLCQK